MTNHDLYVLALSIAGKLLLFLSFTLCAAMLVASLFLSYRFFKEGNKYASFGSSLYILVSLIALWGLLK
jgi:hypothetical protein